MVHEGICSLEGPMRFLPHSLPIAAAPILLLTAGCTEMRTVERDELSPPSPQTRVWVTRADHTTLVVDSARVSADTLVGIVDGEPQRLPLAETAALRIPEPAPDRTAGLVFLGASGVLALAVHFVARGNPINCYEYAVPGHECCVPFC